MRGERNQKQRTAGELRSKEKASTERRRKRKDGAVEKRGSCRLPKPPGSRNPSCPARSTSGQSPAQGAVAASSESIVTTSSDIQYHRLQIFHRTDAVSQLPSLNFSSFPKFSEHDCRICIHALAPADCSWILGYVCFVC